MSTILSLARARRAFLDRAAKLGDLSSGPSNHITKTRGHFRSIENFGRYDELSIAIASFKAETADEAVCQLAVLANMAERTLSCGCVDRSSCGCRPKNSDDQAVRLAFSIYEILKPLCATDIAPLVRDNFCESRNPWIDFEAELQTAEDELERGGVS